MLQDRGDDPEKQPEIYAGMVRAALKDKPSDIAITMHLCRGNFRSTFIASGGYEPVADVLFNSMPVDGYFMEWDSDRAGGFEPLRFLPKGKTVVLGLVTSKTGVLEKQGRHQAPHRGGREIRRPRPALPFAPVRLRLHGGGQRPCRGRAMGQASHDRRSREGGLGLSKAGLAGPAARLAQPESADGVEP